MTKERVDISIIIPCRNEENHIKETIKNIIAQEGAGTEFSFELLIIDGKSDDNTATIIKEEISRNPNIKLIHNEKKTTPAALNMGITRARGRYIAFLGAHAKIADDYLLSCLRTIEKVKSEAVGGPWKAEGQGYIGKAIALAFQSPFAVGGARNHDLNYEGTVDSTWGIFCKRDVFDKIGLYDEELIRNQDDEFCYRLNKSGGKIWQSCKIRYSYYCRNDIKSLFRQYVQYGYWKVRVIQKHKLPASIRHVIPGTFTGSLIVLAIASLFSDLALNALTGLLGLYSGFILLASIFTCARPSYIKFIPVMPVILIAFHLGYGFGFLKGIWDFIIIRKHLIKQIQDVPLTR